MSKFKTAQEAMLHVRDALTRAKAEESNIPSTESHPAHSILQMRGMSGRKFRHLLNNLCSTEGLTYAEVGTWSGSTFLSAMYGNGEIKGITCDNWSQFGGPKDLFIESYTSFRSWDEQAELLSTCQHLAVDADFRKVDFNEWGPIDIYFFDGPHSRQDQMDGILAAWDALSDVAIILVDDWNWAGPRLGTFDAFDRVGIQPCMQVEIHSPPDGWVPSHSSHDVRMTRFAESDWHNGIALFVVTK